MKNYPIDLFVEVVRTVSGRMALFLGVLAFGEVIGVSIGLGRAELFSFAAYVGLGFVSLLSSGYGAFIGLSLLVILFIYLRFEMRHWLLLPAFLCSNVQGYLVGDMIRHIG